MLPVADRRHACQQAGKAEAQAENKDVGTQGHGRAAIVSPNLQVI
jgi:hypothetical protein